MVSRSARLKASSANTGAFKPSSRPKKMKGAIRSAPSPPPRLIQRRGKLEEVVTPEEDSKKQQKYIHVHHFMRTNLFGAWFNDPSKAGKKQRLFFGSHLTAYLAARAQDRAALKYKPSALDPSGIILNFREEDYAEDEQLRRMLTNDEFGELLRKESRPKYTKMEPTPCLRKFLEEEAAAGNIPTLPVEVDRKKISLKTYLEGVMRKRNTGPVRQAQVESSAEESESESEPESEYEETDEESEDVGNSHAVLEAPRVVRTPARKVKLVGRFSSLAEILTQPARPARTKRSTSEVTPLKVNTLQPKGLLASKWGDKRSRSNASKSPLAPRTATEFKVVTKLPAKLRYKIQKMESKSSNPKTVREASMAVRDSLPNRNKLQYKLNKFENTKSPGRQSLQTASGFERLVSAAALAQVEDTRAVVSKKRSKKLEKD